MTLTAWRSALLPTCAVTLAMVSASASASVPPMSPPEDEIDVALAA